MLSGSTACFAQLYFRSEKRVDFRELVKELYKQYKTRIWMCAVEKTPDSVFLLSDSEK